tara:strand:+ start:6920 stop:7699 length:780 start_codon:yes stop_codon:yes gene_type:complete
MMAQNRVALITAGASGIGKVIAECLLADGVSVHVSDVDSSAIERCLAANPGITATLGDMSRVDDVDALFRDVHSTYGRLDILVNNVGIAGPTAPVEEVEPEAWDRTIAVNLNSIFYVTRLAVPMLRESRGCMINMSSNAALFGFPLRSPYTAAKWALVGLTKTWAMELGPHGVRVNALCPGSVSGPRIDRVIEKEAEERGFEPDAIRDVYRRQSSMRAFVNAEDIAETVKFLCSSAGKHISGQALAIDGHTEGLSNWLL